MAIEWAKPERALTLTLVAGSEAEDPWPEVRVRIKRWRQFMKRMGSDPGEYVAHVEPNPRGTGFHAHLWQHGPRVDFAASDRAAEWAGMGWVHTEAVRREGGSGSYGLKLGLYGVKGAREGMEAASEYLRVNGGRLTHQSRGFFRGLAVRDAERAALAGRGESEWAVYMGRYGGAR